MRTKTSEIKHVKWKCGAFDYCSCSGVSFHLTVPIFCSGNLLRAGYTAKVLRCTEKRTKSDDERKV